jgi:hypothetical protein
MRRLCKKVTSNLWIRRMERKSSFSYFFFFGMFEMSELLFLFFLFMVLSNFVFHPVYFFISEQIGSKIWLFVFNIGCTTQSPGMRGPISFSINSCWLFLTVIDQYYSSPQHDGQFYVFFCFLLKTAQTNHTVLNFSSKMLNFCHVQELKIRRHDFEMTEILYNKCPWSLHFYLPSFFF